MSEEGIDLLESWSTTLFKSLDCTEEQTKAFIQLVLDDIQLFDRKQRDYGPRNISTFGEKGVLVRAHDKMARLVNLLWNLPGTHAIVQRGEQVETLPANEPIEDSWQDLSVYGVIARLVRTGQWLDS